MKRKNGFTLIEVMIVVAVIGLLVAIAFPSLIRVRVSANEAGAKASLRTMITALENYRADQNPPSYPINLAGLAGALPPYLDPLLGSGQAKGYTFSYNSAPQINIPVGAVNFLVINGYSIGATPISPGMTGNVTYYTNSVGTIYVDRTDPYGDPGMGVYTPTPPAGFN